MLILRPRPGAGRTAARAAALGLEPVIAPLFTVRPLPWHPPDAGGFDAVMLTSANAARLGGAGLAAFLALPCYAVGEATATAARDAGFDEVRTGRADGGTLTRMMAEAGVAHALHLAGSHHTDPGSPSIRIEQRLVYASDAVAALPPSARCALHEGALTLIHSSRAASVFGALVDAARLDRASLSLAAISREAAVAAGAGWKTVAAASAPRDAALLELAAKLCQSATGEDEGRRA